MPRFNLNPAQQRWWRYLFLLLLLIAGIATRYYFPPTVALTQHFSFWAFLFLSAMLMLWRTGRMLGILALCFALGMWRADGVLALKEARFSCLGTWQVQDFPLKNQPIGQRLSLRLLAGDCPLLRGQALQGSTYQQSDYQIGDSFVATLSIRSGRSAYYTHLPQHITPQHHPLPVLLQWRSALASRIDALFPKQNHWVRALLIGDRSLLDTRLREMLQKSGTSHLLAISGLHLAVMMAMFYFLGKVIATFSPLRYYLEPRSLALCFALLSGLIFVLLSAAQPPIMRAWLMFACLLLMWFNFSLSNGLQALSHALWIILILDPIALFSLSTWLSFLATAAVIVLMRRLKQVNIWWQWLGLQVGISLALLPLVWSIFGGISAIGVAVNLIVIPWLGLVLWLLLAALCFASLATLASLALAVYLRPIELAAQLPFAYIEPFYQPPLLTAIALSVGILCQFAGKSRWAMLCLGVGFVGALPVFWQREVYLMPNARITSAIVYLPHSAPIIINTGYHYRERNDVKRYFLPQLRQRGSKPQAIILSRNSPYSTGGINTLLQAYPDTAIYSLVPMPELSFAHQYCPELPKSGDFYFSREQQHCRLHIGQQRFSSEDIQQGLKGLK